MVSWLQSTHGRGYQWYHGYSPLTAKAINGIMVTIHSLPETGRALCTTVSVTDMAEGTKQQHRLNK